MKKLGLLLVVVFCFFPVRSNQGAHFLSLKSSEVNLRVGPGGEYPVIWILTKAGLPVRLIAEYNNWRKVQLVDGTEGWVHVNIVSRKNTAIVRNPNFQKKKNGDVDNLFYAIMYKYNSNSRPIARIEENVVVRVLKKEEEWIKVEVNRIKGWVERKNLWGVEE